MLEDIDGGAGAATRLAGGAPLHSTLDVADPGDWLALDAGVREMAWHRPEFLPAWEHTAPLPADLTRLGESRLALALCHRDGRIRQKAVRQSVRYPGLLPLVVIRCADWVGPVRDHARQLLREALNVDSALGLAPLILRVGRRDRGDAGVDVLGRVLRQASQGQLAVLFSDPDRNVRRFAYRLAVEGRLLRAAELARAAAGDQDTVVQDLCATAALTALGNGDAYEDVLPPLLSARNPRARSAGVTALRRAGRSEQAKRFLGDRSTLVRACARYVVRQHGGDPAAWYRERCTMPDDPELAPGAVIGLAECGNRADAGLLRPLLMHPAAGVRARAVAGLRTLDCVDAEQLWPLLEDPAAGVVRETAATLLPSAKELPADWLLERTGSDRPRHVRVGAFRLLDTCGGIVALRAAVGLLEDPDMKLRTWAAQSVQRWHPSPDERRGDAEVGELLDRSGHLFSDYVLRRRKWEAGLDIGDCMVRNSAQYAKIDSLWLPETTPCGVTSPQPRPTPVRPTTERRQKSATPGERDRVMQKYAIIQHITRFFRPPREARRQPPTFARQLAGLWLFALAFGAGLSALGWDVEFGMVLLLLFYGDIIEGVRHRWPAALAAVAALWGGGRLTSAVLPGALDNAWAQSVESAVGVTLGLAVSAAITRLPERRRHRPAGGHDSGFGGQDSR